MDIEPVTPTTTVPIAQFSKVPFDPASVNWVSITPQYEAMNDLIGVEPFTTDAIVHVGTKSAFATAKQKTELTPLKVVFGTEKILPGMTVFVSGDLCVHPDAKRVFEIDGRKVIFLSVKEIKLVRKFEYPKG